MTAPYPSDLVALIDARIGAAYRALTEYGTVTYRDTTGAGVTVVLDGPGTTVQCKVFANVDVLEGDRVGVVRFGEVWTVVGCYTRRGPTDSGINQTAASGTTTSGSMVSMPGTPSFPFLKRYDDTRVKVYMQSSCFSTVSATAHGYGVALNGVDYLIGVFYHTNASLRMQWGGEIEISALPAGSYTVVGRWDRESGTGVITQTVDLDWTTIRACEIPRPFTS